MKRNKLFFPLVALLLLGVVLVSAQDVIRKGDVNGDGVVNIADIVEVINHRLGKPSDRFNLRTADVNGDGNIDEKDIQRLVEPILEGKHVLDTELDNLLKETNTGAYEGLFFETGNTISMNFFISCLASDEMLGGGGLSDKVFHNIDLLDADVTEAWYNYKEYITNTNNVIQRIKDLQPGLEDANVRHAMGEALFLRAYYYQQMASLFGTVPVITDNSSWEQKMSSSTPEKVWGQIISDLREAIVLMDGYSPTLTVDDSRIGKYAAEAMLARAYLFYTGYYCGINDIALGDATVDLTDGTVLTKKMVVDYLNDCIKNSGFSLVSDYRNLWPYTNRLTVEDYNYTKGKNLKWVEDDDAVNPEVLFKIKYNKNANWGTTMGYSNQPALFFGVRVGGDREKCFPFGQGWGAGTVSPGLYSDWAEAEPNDMRRDASIQDMSQMDYTTTDTYVQETPYHEKKISSIACYSDGEYAETFEKIMYADGNWAINPPSFQNGNIHPLNLIRFADVLLMHSELTGTVDGINQVRKRAGLSPLSAYSLSALQQERRWELAFEGVRWNDMRRWGDDYCKAALDKQMNQPIKNDGVDALNPQGVSNDVVGFKSYSQSYSRNHGFFSKPASEGVVGSEALALLQGKWVLDEQTSAAGCYGTLLYEHAPISQFLAEPASNGLVKKYTREEMKSLPGKHDKGEMGAFAYIEIIGSKARRYNASGDLLAEGDIDISLTDNFDWRICSINLNGRVLFNGQEGSTSFDLVNLSDDGSMMLVEANKIGKDSETTFWSLRKMTYEEELARRAHGTKWSYAMLNGNDYSTGNPYTVGTWGLGTFNNYSLYGGNGSVPTLYAFHIESVTPSDLSVKLSGMGIDTSNGEADPFAYMVLDLNEESISRYTSDGKLIGSGPVSISTSYNMIEIKTSETGNILAPYSYRNKGNKVQSYYMRFNRQEPSYPDYAALTFRETGGDENFCFDYWLFAQRGLTSAELDDLLVVKQQNSSGEPYNEGHYLTYSLGDAVGSYTLNVTCTDGTAVVYDNETKIYKVKVPRGKTEEKTLRFTLFNANGINATAERTLTMTNNDPLTQDQILMAGSGSKTWTWDKSVGSEGSYWGNMGYCGGAGSDVALKAEGQWWGISLSDNDIKEYTEDGELHGDESPDATMVLDQNGNVKCYNDKGVEIRTGSYEITDYDASNPKAWRVGYFETTPGAILLPYEMNSGGNMPTKFDLVYLSDSKFCLVYPKGGDFNSLGNWGEATFWHFTVK